jgi:hypothetical protein
MARDTAADTFTARVPIQQMDRPSVERELRHVHNDSTHYTTAHAARDALNAARASADTPTANPEPAEQAPRDANPATAMELAPPGGWTDADRVQPTSRDTSSYLSAQRYPLGTELTVYAVGEDRPGRRLGHGVVVDHPSSHHVTVESPLGTKRVAAISHVSLADASSIEAQSPGGHTPTVSETPAQKWAALCDAVDERITADPHWPALAAQLDRVADGGTDVGAVLHQVTADNALPDDHPARSLAYRVADVVPDLRSPARMRTDAEPAPAPRTAPPAPPPSLDPGAYRPGPRR